MKIEAARQTTANTTPRIWNVVRTPMPSISICARGVNTTEARPKQHTMMPMQTLDLVREPLLMQGIAEL